jgi:hypothetical protein
MTPINHSHMEPYYLITVTYTTNLLNIITVHLYMLPSLPDIQIASMWHCYVLDWQLSSATVALLHLLFLYLK